MNKENKMKKILLIISLCIVCLYWAKDAVLAEDFYDAIATPYQTDANIVPQSDGADKIYINNLIAYKINGLWGFYSNSDKSVHIPPTYSDVQGINSNFIKVKRSGEWGVIDNRGNQIIKPSYDNITVYSADKFLVESKGFTGIIGSDGRIIIPVSYESIYKLNNNYFKVTKDNKYGLLSVTDGKIVVPVSYDDIVLMKNYFKVKLANKWGVLGSNQKNLVPVSYDNVKILNKTYFGVRNNKKWGVINVKTGQIIVPVSYEAVTIGDSGNLRVKQNGQWMNASDAENSKRNDEVKSISPSSRVFIDQNVYTRTDYYYSKPPKRRKH